MVFEKTKNPLLNLKNLPRVTVAFVSNFSHTEELYKEFLQKLKNEFSQIPCEEIRLNAIEVSLETIFNEIATFPLFESCRFLFIRNSQYLLAELEKKEKQLPKAHLIKNFEKILQNFPESTYVLFHFSEKKIPEKFSFLLEKAYVYKEEELKERDLPLFLLQRAKSLGYEMSLEASHAIVKQCAYMPNKAIKALEDLMLYKLKDKKISQEDVFELLESDLGELRWKILESLAQRNIKEALRYFCQSYFENGIASLGSWFKLFSDLSRDLLLHRAGLSYQEISEILGLKNPQAQKRLKEMEHNYKTEEIEKILSVFSQFDHKLRLDMNPHRSQVLLINFLLFLSR